MASAVYFDSSGLLLTVPPSMASMPITGRIGDYALFGSMQIGFSMKTNYVVTHPASDNVQVDKLYPSIANIVLTWVDIELAERNHIQAIFNHLKDRYAIFEYPPIFRGRVTLDPDAYYLNMAMTQGGSDSVPIIGTVVLNLISEPFYITMD